MSLLLPWRKSHVDGLFVIKLILSASVNVGCKSTFHVGAKAPHRRQIDEAVV